MVNNEHDLHQMEIRFYDECESITNYTDLMDYIAQIPYWEKVEQALETLQEYNIVENIEEKYEFYKGTLENNPYELENFFKDHYTKLDDKVKYFGSQVDKLKHREKINSNDFDDTDESIMTYIETSYHEEEIRIEELEELQNYFYVMTERLLEDAENYPATYSDYKERIQSERIKSLMDKFCFQTLTYHEANLQYVVQFLNDFSMLLKINDSENILNVYRQGFILLIASFDATVFDMTKVLLSNNFFKYMKKFDKDGKIKYSDIDKLNSFEQLIEKYIDITLKGKYLKEIIGVLQGLGVKYTSDNFSKINECINRRNIHLHNQGKVDVQYIEKYNIYSFEINQTAMINREYFNQAVYLCKETIKNIYEWIKKEIN